MSPANRLWSECDLIFRALCLRARSSTNVSPTMTRKELEQATGLRTEALVDALRNLVAPINEDLPIYFVNDDPDQITIGPAWSSRCEDMDETRAEPGP
jgi:hypothetical protein